MFGWWKPLQLLLLQPHWSFIASLLSGITRYSSYTSVTDPDRYIFQEVLILVGNVISEHSLGAR